MCEYTNVCEINIWQKNVYKKNFLILSERKKHGSESELIEIFHKKIFKTITTCKRNFNIYYWYYNIISYFFFINNIWYLN